MSSETVSYTSTKQQALKLTLPVFFGFVPMGIAFGIMFDDLGYHWIYAVLMGLIVFAGSVQFLSIGLLAMKAGILEIGLATFILNSRQMFFGLSLLRRYQVKGWRKLYLIFVLTDETYSLVTAANPKEGQATELYLSISFLNHMYWVVGCALGALLSRTIQFDSTGMDFTLTALFIVLALEQFKRIKVTFPFLIALIMGLGCLFVFGKSHMLLTSIIMTIAALLVKGRQQKWT